jgi:pyruvate dehydrogenase E1 component beta subunit
VEGRSLFSMQAEVPEQPYRIRFGQAALRRKGRDLTLVAIGNQVPLALRVASELAAASVEAEVIDLRTLAPWDQVTVCESVARTGRLIVADPGWRSFGAAAEIMATVARRKATSSTSDRCGSAFRTATRR